MKKILLPCCLFLFSLSIFAQRAADNVIKMGATIDDIIQNPITGIIVVKEGQNVRGIDPETKQEVWNFDVKKAIGSANALDIAGDADLTNIFKDKRSLEAIPNTPYVQAIVNYKYFILDTEKGQVVYNSANNPAIIFNAQYLADQNEYLVIAKESGKVVSSLIDLNTGQAKWKTAQGEAKSLFASLFAIKANNSNEAKVSGNTIFSLYMGKLFAIDRTSGKLLWTAPEEYTKIYPTQNGNNIIVINSKGTFSSKQYLNVLDAKTGKTIWEDAIKTKQIVYLEDWGNKILVAHYSGFNFYNLQDGSKVWKKDARGDGLKKVISIDNDYLYVAENEMMLIDKDGQKKWKSFIEISDNKEDAINYLGKVEDKVLYLTATYGNMVDYKSGRKLWKRNMKFNEKRPLLSVFDEASQSFLVYNDEELFKFDPKIADKPDAFAKVNIKREKELNSIELFPWGVALSGPVEVMGVGKDGVVKYHNTYTQPGEGNRMLGKGLGIVGSTYLGISSAVDVINGSEIDMVYRDENGVDRTAVLRQEDKGKMNSAAAKGMSAGLVSSITSGLNKRYNAMKQNKNYAYIFAKDDATDNKVLVKVKKEDGKVLDKVIFQDNRPMYEVDPATETLFYAYKNELRIFQAKK